jgi:glycosyltransferase involved in cell wall biosynthesis
MPGTGTNRAGECARRLTIALYGDADVERFERSCAALAAHTTAKFSLVVLDESIARALRVRLPSELESRLVRSRDAAAEEDVFWRAFDEAPQADVVLLSAGVEVTPGWDVRLRRTAEADSVCATASALVSEGALPRRPRLWSARRREAEIDTVVPRPAPGLVYVRRNAMNLVRESMPPDAGEDFPTSVLHALDRPGFLHRLVPAFDEHSRHPSKRALPNEADASLADGMSVGAPPRGAVSVTLDGRCLDRPLAGTAVHLLNLARALVDTAEVELSVLLPTEVHESVRDQLVELEGRVELVPSSGRGGRRSVFHRTFSAGSVAELRECVGLGHRFVLTQQDMIMYRTGQYFPSDDTWRLYREATLASFEAADHVCFFSSHTAADAASEWTARRSVTVVPPGIDHSAPEAGDGAVEARRLLGDSPRPFALVLGNAFAHKNRLFALRLTHELVARHDWHGMLVLAGHPPAYGSSVADERRYVSANPDLKGRVLDLGPVSEAEKRWLYGSAALVLFPSLYEGFGLVPFEAAAAGTPAVYAWRSSLPEYLPEAGALLEGWEMGACGERVLELLTGRRSGAALVQAISQSGAALTWSATADAYVEAYRRLRARVVRGRPRRSLARWRPRR